MAAAPTEASPAAPEQGRIAVVLKGYPRLSETFVAQELLGLEKRGLKLDIHSLRAPYDPTTHPIHGEIRAGVNYLPEYLWRAPRRVFAAWRRARKLPGYARARQQFRADYARDRTPNRVRRFGQACVLAGDMSDDTAMVYAHFLHTPASVARYAAAMRGLPFAVSAHAKDIWTTPAWDKRQKLADAQWVTTCTRYGAEHLRDVAAGRGTVHLNYHGVDVTRFFGGNTAPDGTGDGPLLIASVGRLVVKKGYSDLLNALARLPEGIDWRFEHIGGGDLEKPLAAQADRLEIADRITWHGRRPQSDVRALLARADMFVLASTIAKDGDRDGLPNVLMEAQAVGVACISTAISAIPELIIDGETGRLVPAGDPDALAAAIAELAHDSDARARLAAAGARRVRAEFGLDEGLDFIAAELGGTARRTRTAA